MLNGIEMVVFDLFGTLVQFGKQHHPFRKVHIWAREQGHNTEDFTARNLLTVNGDLESILNKIGVILPDEMLLQCQSDIENDLSSLTLFDDVIPTLHSLRAAGIKLSICSNVAQPYAVIIDRLLHEFEMLRCLSFEVGAIKPELEIYEWINLRSGVGRQNTLFVGDTQLTDYIGPKKYGFKALHLVRDCQSSGGRIDSLDALLNAEKS